MIRPTKKPPPVNKRHTKPCKYFQHGNCALSAEACNFAHILVPAPPPKGLAVCRYYTTGTCHNGSHCPYKHSDVDSPYQPRVHIAGQEPRAEYLLSSPVDNVYLDGPSMYGSYPSYSGYHHEWSYAAGIGPPQPPGYPSNYILPLPPQSGIPPKSIIPHKARPHPPSPSTLYPGRAHSHFNNRTPSNSTATTGTTSGSDDTSSFSSSSTDLDVELTVATTEDPKYAEHSHEHQSQVVLSDQPSPEHVSPFALPYATGQGGTIYAYPPRPPSGYKPRNSTPSGSRAASRNSIKGKPAHKYKTKPCKFWLATKTCSAGDDCTFRHDEPMPVLPLPVPKQSPSPKPIEAPKPRTPKDNYFPISWRVIGGGVRVGSAKREGSITSDATILSIPSSPSEDAPAPKLALPPLQTPPRKRSNSIPTTPSTSQVAVGSLFSAESPGSL